jgi:hypothetical protein
MGMFGIGLPELLMISILILVVILHGKVIMRVWRHEATILLKSFWTIAVVGIPFVGAGLYMFLGSSKKATE